MRGDENGWEMVGRKGDVFWWVEEGGREGGVGRFDYSWIFFVYLRAEEDNTKRYEKTKKKKRRDVMMLVYHLIVACFACGLSCRGWASINAALTFQAL